jgi:ligand-binding sensor domain-containing protein
MTQRLRLFVQYGVKNGFMGNYARAIIEDKKGSIWVSTDRGVMKYDPSADATERFHFLIIQSR